MRKVAAAFFFTAALGMLAPPAFAQAPAPAPAPKVTINGLIDFVATYYSNWSGGNGPGGTGGLNASDVTNGRDKGWYTRERGVFTITGEVGRTRGVWSLELDFTNGAGQLGNSGNAFNGGTQGFGQSGTSANFDEAVFEKPEEVRLDRKPNPHIAFGFGAHLCLGAAHARLIVRSLLQALVQRVSSITVLDVTEHVEHEAAYDRVNGFDSLHVKFTAR